MKVNYSKAYTAIRNYETLPRKVKKKILGLKLSKKRLSHLLDSVVVVSHSKTMYENPVIKPHLFCPKCGCEEMRGTGNQTIPPEHWEYFHCLRCNWIVGMIDNSPFIHALENKEYGYKLVD